MPVAVERREGPQARGTAGAKAPTLEGALARAVRSAPSPGGAAFVVLMSLALAACAGGSAATDPSAGREQTGANASAAPAETAALPPGGPPTLARLKGLSAAELRAGFGEPTLLRRDGPAQLWQYAGSGCVLHVFLYEDHGAFRVSYAEVRIDDPNPPKPPTCVEWKGRPQAQAPMFLRSAAIRQTA